MGVIYCICINIYVRFCAYVDTITYVAHICAGMFHYYVYMSTYGVRNGNICKVNCIIYVNNVVA